MPRRASLLRPLLTSPSFLVNPERMRRRRILFLFTFFGVTRMVGLGVAEILVVCVIGLLLFGNRLPSLARWLGRSFMEFRKGVSGLEEDIRLK